MTDAECTSHDPWPHFDLNTPLTSLRVLSSVSDPSSCTESGSITYRQLIPHLSKEYATRARVYSLDECVTVDSLNKMHYMQHDDRYIREFKEFDMPQCRPDVPLALHCPKEKFVGVSLVVLANDEDFTLTSETDVFLIPAQRVSGTIVVMTEERIDVDLQLCNVTCKHVAMNSYVFVITMSGLFACFLFYCCAIALSKLRRLHRQ